MNHNQIDKGTKEKMLPETVTNTVKDTVNDAIKYGKYRENCCSRFSLR